ncbi:hypothetical protein DQ237_12840 [Blastococcus sp. TF02-8]|uniref:hypothetical protein n=1 Tax=Blastococcus sp. TF02-8 TaxID=2250574 RepID=UPI000DEA0322|nr:hypothetical protein [Blastococcus sp. TF02-8]RBY96004.1 hypothetical protein DQ237_12840 [Blastococcus sp. TF02-8]
MTTVAVVAAVLAALALGGYLLAGGQRSRPPVRPASRPPAVRRPAPRPAAARVVVASPAPAPRRIAPPPEEVRRVLARRLDADWEQAQRLVRQAVAEAEHDIEVAMRAGVQTTSFHAATNLHRRSWQTADRAHAGLRAARAAERAIGSAIRQTHEAARAHGVGPSRATLDVLHRERTAVRCYLDQYEKEVDELNLQTRGLKHHIRDSFGSSGLQWYLDLEERNRRRREERYSGGGDGTR